MQLFRIIMSEQKDLINELLEKGIEAHTCSSEYSAQIINYLALFTFF